MCDKESFAKLRDQMYDLSKETAAQAEQIKTLFASTAELKATMQGVFTRILWVFGIIALLAILALIYGALGPNGFNAVTNTTQPTLIDPKRP